MTKNVLIACFVLTLAGCAASVPLTKVTASGKPEVIYNTASKTDVKDLLLNMCHQNSLAVFDSNDSSVICGKEKEGSKAILAQLVMGNSYSTQPVDKVRFTIMKQDNKVKVWADIWMETQMGMGQIKQMDIKDNQSLNKIQAMLDSVAL